MICLKISTNITLINRNIFNATLDCIHKGYVGVSNVVYLYLYLYLYLYMFKTKGDVGIFNMFSL